MSRTETARILVQQVHVDDHSMNATSRDSVAVLKQAQHLTCFMQSMTASCFNTILPQPLIWCSCNHTTSFPWCCNPYWFPHKEASAMTRRAHCKEVGPEGMQAKVCTLRLTRPDDMIGHDNGSRSDASACANAVLQIVPLLKVIPSSRLCISGQLPQGAC